jgi:adenylate kinase family enzyme
MNNLILIRGLPGSGKSTYAARLSKIIGIDYVEADMYFMHNGEYKFDPAKLGMAHKWCFDRAVSNMDRFRSAIVSNTFTQAKEMQNYIHAASERGIPIWIITMHGKYQNVHNVPEIALQRMRDRFQDNTELMSHWPDACIEFYNV